MSIDIPIYGTSIKSPTLLFLCVCFLSFFLSFLLHISFSLLYSLHIVAAPAFLLGDPPTLEIPVVVAVVDPSKYLA